MMPLILRVLGGLVLVVIGSFFVIKSEWMLQTFGSVSWAEEHLGLDGGSRLFYKLLGILTAIVGMMIATGLFGGLLLGVVGPLFGLPRNS